jgi:drug/metabolite transporter (DMT)-like permease
MFILICLFWGSNFILMKKADAAFGPLSVGAGRLLFAVVTLGLAWFIWQRRRWPFDRSDLPALALLALLGFVWPFVVQPYLIGKYQNSSFIGIMPALVPLLTIAVSVPMLRVHPTARQLAGVVIGLACMVLLVGDGLGRAMAWHDLLLAMSVPACYAIANTYVKQRFGQSPATALTLAAMALSVLLVAPLAAATEPVRTGGTTLAWSVAALAQIGILGTAASILMFYILVQTRGPLYAGMVTYIIPLGAMAWGWLDAERISMVQVGAVGVILCMVALVQNDPRGRIAAAASVGPEE